MMIYRTPAPCRARGLGRENPIFRILQKVRARAAFRADRQGA